MLNRLTAWLDARIGIDTATEPERALLRERFTALRRQLPWVYGILLANLLGLHLALGGEGLAIQLWTAPFAVIIIARATHWLRIGGRPIPDDRMLFELRKTFIVALLFCVTFCTWVLLLYVEVGGEHRVEIATFGSLTAIGCCYGTSAFPATARVPLLVLGFPLALALSLDSEPAHVGMGATLTVLILMTRRMLNAQEGAFVRLVSSRFAIETEKKRALEAERIALAEQSRVGAIANTDPLTGLANRRGFLGFLEQLSGAEWRQALILIDLDGFKPINDTFGHLSGDAILIEVSRRLQSVAKGGSVARLGGDEFALLTDCTEEAGAIAMARRAVAAISEPFTINGREMVVSACAGVSVQIADELVDATLRADVALYSAKRSGRGSVALYCSAMQQEFQRRTSIEQALREPGLIDSIDLAFQPIFDLETMELTSFEALARWRHSELGWISPSEFIPITEQISLLEDLSNALLRRAARAALDWPEPVLLSFNLSAVQLCSPGSASRLLAILASAGLPPTRLQIEVTETALLADFELARRNLSQLRRSGVRIALDDFGAGYSSISYLREMRFDAVKLDGSLIASVTESGGGVPLLRGVLALCQAMGQACVAEHIETGPQLDLLRRLGCRYGQGFMLSPPVDAAAAARLVQSPAGRRARSAA